MTDCTEESLEFSRPLDLSSLGEGTTEMQVAANAREREALARRLDLIAIDRLEARLKVHVHAAADRIKVARVEVSGRLSAEITQRCRFTLAPVPARIDEGFRQRYAPMEPDQDSSAGEVHLEIDPETDVLIEPLDGDVLDVGEAVAQQLAVSMDPYPSAPGARLETDPDLPREGPASPFAALKGWRADE